MIIAHPLKLQHIIKRYAGTSTDEETLVKTKPQSTADFQQQEVIRKKHIIEDDTSDQEEEIQSNSDAPVPAMKKPALTQSDIDFLTNNNTLDKIAVSGKIHTFSQNNEDISNNVGNETVGDNIQERTNIFYTAPVLSKEALLLDQSFKVATSHVEEIAFRLGKEIKKSDELVSIWKTHIQAFEDYIKSLSNIPWKKVLIAGASLLTIGAITWKMFGFRAIPNFMGNALSLIPIPKMSDLAATTANNSVPLPNANIEPTIRTIMDTPLTPLAIVAGVGAVTITLSIIRVTLWVLRRSPK